MRVQKPVSSLSGLAEVELLPPDSSGQYSQEGFPVVLTVDFYSGLSARLWLLKSPRIVYMRGRCGRVFSASPPCTLLKQAYIACSPPS